MGLFGGGKKNQKSKTEESKPLPAPTTAAAESKPGQTAAGDRPKRRPSVQVTDMEKNDINKLIQASAGGVGSSIQEYRNARPRSKTKSNDELPKAPTEADKINDLIKKKNIRRASEQLAALQAPLEQPVLLPSGALMSKPHARFALEDAESPQNGRKIFEIGTSFSRRQRAADRDSADSSPAFSRLSRQFSSASFSRRPSASGRQGSNSRAARYGVSSSSGQSFVARASRAAGFATRNRSPDGSRQKGESEADEWEAGDGNDNDDDADEPAPKSPASRGFVSGRKVLTSARETETVQQRARREAEMNVSRMQQREVEQAEEALANAYESAAKAHGIFLLSDDYIHLTEEIKSHKALIKRLEQALAKDKEVIRGLRQDLEEVQEKNEGRAVDRLLAGHGDVAEDILAAELLRAEKSSGYERDNTRDSSFGGFHF